MSSLILIPILASLFLISAIAFVGVFSFGLSETALNGILPSLVGFAAGALIGGAFLHLLPETIEMSTSMNIFLVLSFGFILFFLLERLMWRHCHKGVCEVHPFAYVNLVGDGVHNFIDGLVIAASFLSSIELGIVTSLAVAFHEVPQELGDFGVLVYAGLKKGRALILNFITALAALFGGVVGFSLSSLAAGAMVYLLPFAAGGFIYVAATDLIPELHREANPRKSLASSASFFLGFLFMLCLRLYFSH
jgi:zinc and cadmium transporter